MLYNKTNLWVLYCDVINLIKKSDNIKYKNFSYYNIQNSLFKTRIK